MEVVSGVDVRRERDEARIARARWGIRTWVLEVGELICEPSGT